MNQLLIAKAQPENMDKKVFFVDRTNAHMILPALRSQHFQKCIFIAEAEIPKQQLKFLMHINRLLTKEATVELRGNEQGIQSIGKVVKTIGLHEWERKEDKIVYGKKVQMNGKQEEEKKVKLSIGYQNYQEEEIDEDDLLKNENIKIQKKKEFTGCSDKVRACANCNCGRKKDQPLPSKEELVSSVNEGKPVSGCGKCYLGDSFRCSTCPYAGLPAFKPGDKLKLVDNEKVVVEQGPTVVSGGKVKIEL